MTDWETEVRQMLKSELAREGIGYSALVERLKELGVTETESSVTNKISRGKFSCMFFVQCLRAIGVDTVSVAARIRNTHQSKFPEELAVGEVIRGLEQPEGSVVGHQVADAQATKS